MCSPSLRSSPRSSQNLNTPSYLDSTRTKLLEILNDIEAVPGVGIETGGTNNIAPVGMDVEGEGEGVKDGGGMDDKGGEDKNKKEHQTEMY